MTGVRARLLLAGLVVAGLVEVWLAARTALPGGILARRWVLFREVLGMWAAAAAALACLAGLPRRSRAVPAAVVVVVLLGVALRVAALSDKAPLSDDLYRYAWDGVVQSSGTDPYRYPPSAAELRPLRDPWLWPPDRRPDGTLLNRPGVPTIYPPVAEAWFWLEHRLVPLSARDRGYEAVGLLLDLAVLAVLLSLLRAAGRDLRWAGLYALAPLPVLEAVQNAHVDVLAVLLVLAAVPLAPRRPASAAALLSAAALVKVYPGVLLVLLLRAPGTRLRVVLTSAALAVLAYLPHVLAVGTGVLGYLPGYLQEEQYDAGGRYLLVGLTGLSGDAATAVVALGTALLLVRAVRSELSLPAAGAQLLTGVLLLATPVQPWYALLLLALGVLAARPEAAVVGLAAYPLLFSVVLDRPALDVGRVSYGAAALVVLGAAVARGPVNRWWRPGSARPAAAPRSGR